MAIPVVIVGAKINLYINNQLYKEVESISFSVDYGEYEIDGIDSPYSQELAGGKIRVSGSVNGFRLKLSGGLQAKNMRPLFTDQSAAPYISIRITDRQTSEDILFLPQAKISDESHSVNAKGVYHLNFSFKAQVPYWALDRS